MKKLLLVLSVFITVNAAAQEFSAKEKAEKLAKEEFTKMKYKKKEKFGVEKEMKKEIIATPVVKKDVAFYNGNYVYKDLDYKMEVRTDTNKKPMATLSIAGGKDIVLKDVSIRDAFFHAIRQNADGTEELWEGAFINKSDDGNVEFGLGIKLVTPIRLTEGLSITRIFLKKVSP
jgi:hypothetical protein